MKLYPLFLTKQYRHYYFGTDLIKQKITVNVPDGYVAETWECSDYGTVSAQITNGIYRGYLLREFVLNHAESLLGKGIAAPHFPLLAKFLDASKFLPVHLHANDQVAKLKYGHANGKTEAWHILWAKEGATILAGMKEGVTEDEARQAFRRQDYTAVIHEYPIKSGDTVYIPGGVIHSFGPDALVYEIQQTSDLGQNVMPTDINGMPYSEKIWHANIEEVLDELEWLPKPKPTAGLAIETGHLKRTFLAAGPYFAFERWKLLGETIYTFEHAQVVTNLGVPMCIHCDSGNYILHGGETCLLPAGLGKVDFICERAGDFLVSYVPSLEKDVIHPLMAAGYERALIETLGELSV